MHDVVQYKGDNVKNSIVKKVLTEKLDVSSPAIILYMGKKEKRVIVVVKLLESNVHINTHIALLIKFV